MKTNASPKTIIQAVETVSKRHFNGNVVLRKSPEKMTKNVCRFTLKTLDAEKPGSLTTKQGIKQTKADWSVHQEVMYEILRLDPRPHIYVDTIYGREYNKNPKPMLEAEVQPENNTGKKKHKKEKIRKRAIKEGTFVAPANATPAVQSTIVPNTDNVQSRQNIMNIVQAIKYIMTNPAVLTE